VRRQARALAPIALGLALAGADPAPAPAGDPAPEPVPVLLVPGWSDTAAELELLRQRFREAGWSSERVRAVGFVDPVGSNREHAREVARVLAEVRAATGAPLVDVVAHSMGGLALRYHLTRQEPGLAGVRRAVFLATPHHGTWSALVAWGEGGEEMVPGSDFLMELMRGAPLPPEVETLTVRTPVDLHVLPQESARLAGTPDVELCCPTHAGLLTDPRTFTVVRAFLRDGVILEPPGPFAHLMGSTPDLVPPRIPVPEQP
jgi:triacylglycerol lipase